MLHAPSAMYHLSDAAGGNVQSSKINAIFQAAKRDLLQVIQLRVITIPAISFFVFNFKTAAAM